jgi:hypothetical protein
MVTFSKMNPSSINELKYFSIIRLVGFWNNDPINLRCISHKDFFLGLRDMIREKGCFCQQTNTCSHSKKSPNGTVVSSGRIWSKASVTLHVRSGHLSQILN